MTTAIVAGAMRAGLRATGAGLALAVVAGAVACDGAARARIGGTAVVMYAGAPRAANPLIASDAYSHEMNRFLLFHPLLRYDDELGLAPGLARDWEVEGDTAAVFRLHPEVRWSDGRPTTAHDVVFTFRRALDPATNFPDRGQIGHWRSVKAVDSLTVRLSFDPVREPLASLPLLPVVPRHVLDTVPAEAMASSPFNLQPVTNGPFRVREARPGDRWVFEADTAFPAALGGRPHLDRLVWRAVPESTAQLAELQAGDGDLAVGVRPEMFERMAAMEGYRGIERPTLNYTTIAWNGRRAPLGDARIRRALGHAIDRDEILRSLRGGHGAVATGPVPPGHWAHADGLSPQRHDPEAARALLAEAGVRDRDGDGIAESASGDPLEVTLLVPAESDFNRDLAQVVQADLREVGVRLEIRPVEFATLVQVITGPDRAFDAVLLGLNADPRLDLRSLFHSESMAGPFQLAGYRSPVVDSLLDDLETTERARAPELWAEVQRVLAEDQPWTFLYSGTELILARERIRGVEAGLPGLMESAAGWWIEGQGDG